LERRGEKNETDKNMPGFEKGRIKIRRQVYILRGRDQGVAGYTPIAGFHSFNTSMHRVAYSDLVRQQSSRR